MSEQVEQGPTAAFIRSFDQDDAFVMSELPMDEHIMFGFVDGVFVWKRALEGD